MKARLRTQIAGNKRMTYKLDIVNIARRGPFSPHNLVDDKRSLEERENPGGTEVAAREHYWKVHSGNYPGAN